MSNKRATSPDKVAPDKATQPSLARTTTSNCPGRKYVYSPSLFKEQVIWHDAFHRTSLSSNPSAIVMSSNYDVAFRFVNDTQWTATLEAWGPNPHGRDNGVMLILRPQDRVAFMQSANLSYYYCVRHHGIEAGFSAKILVDTPTNMSDIMPQALPANYQTITPLSPRAGVTVRRYRPLTHYVSG